MPVAGCRACDHGHDPPSDLSARRSMRGADLRWAPQSLWGPFYSGL